jgi:hypothetical protein
MFARNWWYLNSLSGVWHQFPTARLFGGVQRHVAGPPNTGEMRLVGRTPRGQRHALSSDTIVDSFFPPQWTARQRKSLTAHSGSGIEWPLSSLQIMSSCALPRDPTLMNLMIYRKQVDSMNIIYL